MDSVSPLGDHCSCQIIGKLVFYWMPSFIAECPHFVQAPSGVCERSKLYNCTSLPVGVSSPGAVTLHPCISSFLGCILHHEEAACCGMHNEYDPPLFLRMREESVQLRFFIEGGGGALNHSHIRLPLQNSRGRRRKRLRLWYVVGMLEKAGGAGMINAFYASMRERECS